MAGNDWLDCGPKRLVYCEYLAGTGGDIFSNLAGASSPGTIGMGKSDRHKKQIRPVAGANNLPNKTMISSIQHYAKRYPDKPVMANYIQCMLLAGIGGTKPNSADEYWNFFEELNNCHSVWASNHPGGNAFVDKEASWFSVWQDAVESLGWTYTPIAPVITSRAMFGWAVCIINNSILPGPGRIEQISQHLCNEIEYWQNNLPNSVFKFNHIDLIIENKDNLLLELCMHVNNDVERDKFDFMYQNYRNIRMPIYEAFEKVNGSEVDKLYNSINIIE